MSDRLFTPCRLPRPGEGFSYYFHLFQLLAQGTSFQIPNADIALIKAQGPAHQWGTFTHGLAQPAPTPPSQVGITACIMTHNAQATLEPCLHAAQTWADQIIILDSGSSDHTLSIAKRFTDDVYTRPWPGNYADQRNHLIAKVRTPWMVMIDADEVTGRGFGTALRTTITLADQIGVDLLWLPRRWLSASRPYSNHALHCRIETGHWLFDPDPQARVARISSGPYYQGALHETLELTKPGKALLIGFPQAALLHLRLQAFSLEQRRQAVNLRNQIDPDGPHNLQLLPETRENRRGQWTLQPFEDPIICELVLEARSGRERSGQVHSAVPSREPVLSSCPVKEDNHDC